MARLPPGSIFSLVLAAVVVTSILQFFLLQLQCSLGNFRPHSSDFSGGFETGILGAIFCNFGVIEGFPGGFQIAVAFYCLLEFVDRQLNLLLCRVDFFLQRGEFSVAPKRTLFQRPDFGLSCGIIFRELLAVHSYVGGGRLQRTFGTCQRLLRSLKIRL